MSEVTLSAKNQVVVPKDTRKAMGLKAGDKVPMFPSRRDSAKAKIVRLTEMDVLLLDDVL